jgi:uncharacterized protein (TIGR02300 family)
MSTKAQRGTKRTCQNPECGSRFYDLARDPIVCPICESVYELAVSASALAASQAEEKAARRPAKKPAFVPAEAAKEDAPQAEGEDLVVIEGEEEEAAGTEDDETFLEEEEEDGSDMSNIIGGPVDDKDEPSWSPADRTSRPRAALAHLPGPA